MSNGTHIKNQNTTVYLHSEDDNRLLPIVEHLPPPLRQQFEGLWRNEGYTILRALERIGVLIAG